MNAGAQFLLVAAVAGVGILHTLVPDHWLPIALLARQRGWTRAQTARAAIGAGTGHVVSTLIIALIVWGAGALAAARFGRAVSLASSLALVGFGLWIAIASLRELAQGESHDHTHVPERTALLLIVGSSPMIEGIPAFFAASRYGVALIATMSIVFALSTILTYAVLCVYSAAGMSRIRLGPFERYGEVLSGGFIAAIGTIFLIFPIL